MFVARKTCRYQCAKLGSILRFGEVDNATETKRRKLFTQTKIHMTNFKAYRRGSQLGAHRVASGQSSWRGSVLFVRQGENA